MFQSNAAKLHGTKSVCYEAKLPVIRASKYGTIKIKNFECILRVLPTRLL